MSTALAPRSPPTLTTEAGLTVFRTAMPGLQGLLDGAPVTAASDRLLALTTGRFYTHEFVGKRLAREVAKLILRGRSVQVRVVDPFCGDGRLVAWLLEALGRDAASETLALTVDLWDCDRTALRVARRTIRALSQEVGSLRLSVRHWDTFESAPTQYGRYDVVVTNPPWELLKPDPRQLREMVPAEAKRFAESLRNEDARLSRLYPASTPTVRYAGWGLNLSRCGIEVALRLLDTGGTAGLVVPASVFADSSSRGIRELMVNHFRMDSFEYFPSEARLFQAADHPAVSVVLRQGPVQGVSSRLTVFDKSLQVRASGRLVIPQADLVAADFVIPGQLSPKAYAVLRRFRHFEEFSQMEGDAPQALLAGRELDETRIAERLTDHGSVRFVKGRMIRRFAVELASARFLAPGVELPDSVDHYRVAWRDVSRMSQARRIHAALLPPGVVTGNSLSIAYFRDDDSDRLRALLALMSSIVFEFQVRTRLATSHISLAAVRKGRLPSLENEGLVRSMARICDRCLGGSLPAQIELEVRSAQAYGIDRKRFAMILDEFGRLPTYEKEHLLSCREWEVTPKWIES